MRTLRITEGDLHGMVLDAVRTIMEGADEARGVSMSNHAASIDSILDYIKNEWETRRDGHLSERTTYSKDLGGREVTGELFIYNFQVPEELTSPLGLAHHLNLDVWVNDYRIDEAYLGQLTHRDRGVGGVTNIDPASTMYDGWSKFYSGNIEVRIGSVNGSYDESELHATLYHELNHLYTALRTNNGVGSPERTMNTRTMTRRRDDSPYGMVHKALDFSGSASQSVSPETTDVDYKRKFRAVNYLLYGLWETTERNARIEEVYGLLRRAGIQRDEFEKWFDTSRATRHIREFEEMIEISEGIPVESDIWTHVGRAIRETSKGRAKKRFVSRSRQLLEDMRKRMLRAARYYFDERDGLLSRLRYTRDRNGVLRKSSYYDR